MNQKILLLAMTFILFVPISFADNGLRTCEIGNDCNLGDFVYNNNYLAYTNDICTINITHPNETLAVINGNMSNHSDGWYNYTFRCNEEGLYKAEMYCINNTDIGRLNRNFECVDGNKYYLLIGFVVLLVIALIMEKYKDNDSEIEIIKEGAD